jgi:hypothetical protein
MKMNTRVPLYVLLVLFIALMLTSGAANSQSRNPQIPNELQGNVFTYQGRLTSDNNQVNVNCDFLFSLWDAESGPLQVGDTLAKTILVKNGLFTANLDFGSGAFDGETRWLEISVRCPTGIGSYTTIGRQVITAAPYASYSLKANHALDADYALNSDMLDGHHASDFLLPNETISDTLSVSAAAFSPGDNSCVFTNTGMELFASGIGRCGAYNAGLQIPDGVTITKLIFHWKDGSNLDAVAFLRGNNFNGGQPLELASVYTNGNGNVVSNSSINTSILVDNSQYSYFLRLDVPDENIYAYGIQIEYEYTSP